MAKKKMKRIDPATVLPHAKFKGRPHPYRFDPTLVIPFAPRWLGMKNPLDGRENIRNMENFVFGLGWQEPLWSYFPIPTEGNFLFNLATEWDYFIAHPPEAERFPSGERLNAQPVWDKNAGRVVLDSSKKRPGLAGKAEKRCLLEPVGGYSPAHFGDPQQYGIYLSQGGLVNAAAEIHVFCPDEPRHVVLATACHFAYCHLVTHAWVEDLCALLDFHLGCKDERALRPYVMAHRRHGSLILMEEALCNTVAFGLLHHFLSPLPADIVKSRRIPSFNRERILAAVDAWLTEHFDARALHTPNCDEPRASRQCVLQLNELLCSVYGYDWEATQHAVSTMLGCAPDPFGVEHWFAAEEDTAWNCADNYPVQVLFD